MQVAVKNQSVVDYIKNDNRFHHIIFKIAGHETIWNIIANSRAHYNRVLVLDLQRPGILSKSYEEHLEIIRCIENGLEKELRAVLISHHDTEDTQNRALEIRKAFPDYFPVEIF